MAEWLTHVLLAYAAFTILSWWIEWLDQKWVAVAMIGSILPDLNQLGLLIPADLVTYVFGVPFDWSGLHTLGGAVVLSAIGALLFRKAEHQRRAFLLLFGGALSHLIVDLPQRYADGHMILGSYAYPLPAVRPPTPGWYVSADWWVVVVAFVVALAVFVLDTYRG